MIEILDYKGDDFKVVKESGEWKIGILRHSERFSAFKALERHLLTDEVFVLLKGRATLYIKDRNDKTVTYKMKKQTVYNVPKEVWHHIKVSCNATVLVVENKNTSKDNTERRSVDDHA